MNESPALPDDLHTLGGFFEAVAAHWKHRESELKRSEAFLAEAQRLSKTGSFSWTVGSDCQVWSEETFRIFDYERSTLVTLEAMLARVHPQDLDLMRELIAGVEDGRAIDHECRLAMRRRLTGGTTTSAAASFATWAGRTRGCPIMGSTWCSGISSTARAH